MSDLLVRRIGRLTTWVTDRLIDAALVIRDGCVEWVGEEHQLPGGIGDLPELDVAGAAVVPGFVDCHTHAVWAGERRADFAARLVGGTYRPGGIAATVAATRAATYEELLSLALGRARSMLSHGTTTAEMKSGYGLTPGDECRLLDIIGDVADTGALTVEATYLGAHVVPPDRNRADYVAEVIATLPAAKRHGARWCDVFCDDGAFTIEESRAVLVAAAAAGLGGRIHAEQLSPNGGARLAAELGCASADHLDYVTGEDAAALAAAGVVGVLVPVASLYTRSGRWGHARRLIDAGVTVAVATDCNPGTAWCESMPYALQLACLEMGLSVDEALRAATLGGAAALRRGDLGQLSVGARGDLAVLETDHEVDLAAHLGSVGVARTVTAGQLSESFQSSSASSASTST